MEFPFNSKNAQAAPPLPSARSPINPQKPPTPSSSSSNPGSSVPHGSPAINPRSCVICRRRKVRCNKQYPCSNCAKAKVQCIFPAPERAKRRPRKPPDGELLARLRRLEGVIQGMGMSVEEQLAAGNGEGTRDRDNGASPQNAQSAVTREAFQYQPEQQSPDGPVTAEMQNDFSRLVINEGKSRYVNNRFWATLSNEVEDLKGILDENSDEEDDLPSPSGDLSSPTPDGAYFFHYSSMAQDLHSLHPGPDHVREYWQVYKEYIDQVLKIIHVPSMDAQMRYIVHSPGKSSKPMEAFLFSMYYAAVTALTPEDCFAKFGESRDVLVKRFKFGVEQALTRANFLISEEILVLQALMIFLVCLRSHEDGRVIWSLCGVVMRLAVSLGLHRDGTNFNLSPFETEMRRRSWWQLVALELRASQDSGIESMILSFPYDTQLPSNVNDEELYPAMTKVPEPRKGITDMTFCILRYDVQKTLHKLWNPSASLQEKERLITECHTHLERDYFNYCDMSKPFDWTVCTVAKLIMARQFLLLYHPYIRTLQQGTIDRLFVTALDTIEFALRLETERKLVKWGWLFKTYNQWHALAFLLSELTRRTKGPLVQRAWRAVNSTLAEFDQTHHDSKRGQLWRPLVKLLNTARLARQRELAHEAQQQNIQNGAELDQPMAPNTRVNPPEYASVAHRTANNQARQTTNGPIQQSNMLPNNDYMLNGHNSNYLDLPSLEPTASNRSNPIDDQYLFDNTSNNVPMTSQFFANTPGLMQNNEPGGALAGGWMGNWPADGDMNSMPEFDASNLQTLPMYGQDPMVSGNDGQGMPYTDWDEVMKELQMGGQPPARYGQSKPPALMGETWL